MPTVSVDQLTTRPDLFQYREAGVAGFDETHVRRIVDEFRPERFDPLMAVANPDRAGHYIVLGGHHRLEAARRLRLDDVPITVLEGDLSTEAGRRRLVDEAIITNYGRKPTNIREDARAARALTDNGANITEVGSVLGKTANEVYKLLWFSKLPPSSQQLAVDAPDLQPAAIETGRAVEVWGLTPAGAEVILRRMYQDSIASGKSPPPATQIRERWRQANILAGTQQAGGAATLPGFEASTDVLVAGWQQAGSEASSLNADRQRLARRLASCNALAEELGVTIEDIKEAAQTRREGLTAEQEVKVREALSGYRESVSLGNAAPKPGQDQTPEEREEAERREAREAMAASGTEMLLGGEEPAAPQPMAAEVPQAFATLEQATLGEGFATNAQQDLVMGEGRGRRASLADPEELLARQRRREAVERGQTELPTSTIVYQDAPPLPKVPKMEAKPKMEADYDWSKDDMYGGAKPPPLKKKAAAATKARKKSEHPWLSRSEQRMAKT